jgi:hypothetical protein
MKERNADRYRRNTGAMKPDMKVVVFVIRSYILLIEPADPFPGPTPDQEARKIRVVPCSNHPIVNQLILMTPTNARHHTRFTAVALVPDRDRPAVKRLVSFRQEFGIVIHNKRVFISPRPGKS